jgi:hypothetical protein
MPRKYLVEGTGDVVTIPDGMSLNAALKRYEAEYMKKRGIKPAGQMGAELEGKANAAATDAGNRYMDENPIMGKVAAYQAGAKNLGRNLAQMALPESLEKRFGVSDEDIKSKQALEAPLKERETGMYTTGEIVPSFVAGAAGKIPQLAKGLPAALAAMGEGAVFGGAVAGPENRGKGAVAGAAFGGAVHGAGRVLSRALQGPAPPSAAAQRAMQQGRQTPRGGVEPFIPTGMSASKTKEGGATKYVYDKILPNFPSASRRLAEQGDDLVRDTYRNMLRQGYGKHADEVIKKFDETDSLLDAARHGEDLVAQAPVVGSNKIRQVLIESGKQGSRGNPTLKQISSTSKRLYKDVVDPPLKRMADEMSDLMRGTPQEGGLGLRKMFFTLVNWSGLFTPGAIARIASSKSFQKYLQGNTWWQKPLQKAMQAGDKRKVQDVLERVIRNSGIQNNQETAEDAATYIEEQFDGQR